MTAPYFANFENATIIGVGAALVDIVAPISEATLAAWGSTKGGMTLIDAERSAILLASLENQTDLVYSAGGSAANTIAGLARLGVATRFIGKIGNDTLGENFTDALHREGTAFAPLADKQAPTGHCIIGVTPDGERSLHTHLGASVQLSSTDIEGDLKGDLSGGLTEINAKTRPFVLFGEAYLWDSPSARTAFMQASAHAHAMGGKVALSLGDAHLCQRHAQDLLAFLRAHVDMVFANEHEMRVLFGASTPPQNLAAARTMLEIVVLTMGDKGALVADPHDTAHIAAAPIKHITDATGAGDQFAAGFLAGLMRHLPLPEAGQKGATQAAQIIQQWGARP